MRFHLWILSAVTAIWLGSASAWAQTAAKPFMITSGSTMSSGTATSVVQQLYPTLSPAQQTAMEGVLMSQYNQKIPGFENDFESQVNNYMTETNFGPITTSFADAGAAAAKTMPVDYASDFSLFTVTAGAGGAVHGINLNNFKNLNQPTITNKQTPDEGAGINASLLVGINLGYFHLPTVGWFDPSRLSVYANFFSYTTPEISGVLKASTTTFGLHGQYRIVEGVSVAPFGLFRWGGVNINTGLTYSDLTIAGNGNFNTSNSTYTFDVPSPGGGGNETIQLTYAYQGTANVSVDIHTFSIPIEASTSLQLANFLTLYAGGGVDINFGSASGKATSNDQATLTLHNQNRNTTATNFLTPTAALLFNSPAYSPHIGAVRGFGGAQINIVVVGLFGQISADTASNYSANFGLRAFW